MKFADREYFFSVIVPVYNVEKYLRECIDSVLMQTYDDYEVLLVDDGSTDSSPQICDEYAGLHNNVYVIHQMNGGLSDARNTGLKYAKGKYVIFIDSDDFLSDKTFFEKAYNYISIQNIRLDLIVFGNDKYFENGYKEKVYLNCKQEYSTCSMSELCNNACFKISAWGKIVLREILMENVITFRKNVYSEDMEWCCGLLIYCENCGIINKNVYQYRQREGSITKCVSEKNVIDVRNNFEYCLQSRGLCPSNKQTAFNQYLSQNLSMFMLTVAELEKREQKKYYAFIKENMRYLSCNVRMREKIIYFCVRLFGVSFTEYLLGRAYFIKRRIREK